MTTDMRISEVYLSIQGEGPRVGRRTIFVRSGGCNLRCPGWPCDTPHAIDPKLYRQEWVSTPPAEVVDRIKVADAGNKTYANICFTGGEPFLQHSTALFQVVDLLEAETYTTLEVFTNGTIYFPDWSLDSLYFVMDWKLPGSGENLNDVQERARRDNILRIAEVGGDNAIKFTIATEEDFYRAVKTYEEYQGENLLWYYGVVWGKLDPAKLIDWVLKNELPWIYTHQIHNVIWDREKRGI